MASTEESLHALECLMTEFFDGRTSNERKREIEELLNNFGQTEDCWRHALFFLTNTKNQYVMMFCMTLLENLINKRWIGLSGDNKVMIRTTLNQYLLSHHNQVPSYIRNKLVKLVVDIGRIDWPHFYPDFLPSILQLVQQPETAMLGIILLQTASEELASPREDLSMSRKDELNRLLLLQVPTILNILNNILESVLERHRHLVTATPPPSPTREENTTPNKISNVLLFSSSPYHSGDSSLLCDMFKSPVKSIHLDSKPSLDDESRELCSLALNCLSHYFSWIPLSSLITPSLLSTIFHFASYGCEPLNKNKSLNESFHFTSQSLGILAMNCINELLSKNCVPQEFEEFLLQMFQQTFHLLQKLTKESRTDPIGNRLKELDESYIDKFTDFLRLFVSIHLRRFESNNQFPVLEFLALLFQYTFKQPSHEGFFYCLEIWLTFLDYLFTKLKERSTDKYLIIDRYKDALITLVSNILQKIQFRYNQSQLEELDDETLDDDSQTEWQHFLRQNLEVIAKVAEIIPEDVFKWLYEPFQEHLDTYMGIDHYVTEEGEARQLNINAENEGRRLHCTLRDLASFLQALGRLSHHFIGEKFHSTFADGHLLMKRLVQASAYCIKTKLFEVSSVAENVLQADFIEVHAQTLATVKAYTHWLLQFYTESQRTNQGKDEIYTVISTIVESVCPLFNKKIPVKVIQSAAHLLISIVTTVRPAFLMDHQTFQSLYTEVSKGSLSDLPDDVQLLVYRSLSHYLLFPWANLSDSEQDLDRRAVNHKAFVQNISFQYSKLKTVQSLSDNKTLQNNAKPVIKKSLKIFVDWIQSLSGEVTKSKQICYQSLQDPIQTTLAIFPVYIHQTDVTDDIMSFFLAMFQGFRVQMGVPFSEQTIQTFLHLFSREQLTEILSSETGAAVRVIEKFLKILQLIVQEPVSAFKVFIPTIINVCMEQIYPIIAQMFQFLENVKKTQPGLVLMLNKVVCDCDDLLAENIKIYYFHKPSPDVKTSLFELLEEILMNNWRYFFKGSVLSKLQNQTEVENTEQFTAILQAYGQSFLQPDILIFKQNLESLEKLNGKWKLYHKKIFVDLMMLQFLTVLLQVLINKSHDLLQEEIVITVYNMASVDFDRFYVLFLPQFLTNMEGLDDNQKSVLRQNFKMDMDLPSFTQSVHRFVNDLRYYRLINTSLPCGSIQF